MGSSDPLNSTADPNFNTQRKFVRVTELRKDGLVAFEFAIGEPDLMVELLMPAAAFDEFCATNKVIFLDEQSQLKVGGDTAEDWQWSLADVAKQRFRQQ